jgi:hypothetical protein
MKKVLDAILEEALEAALASLKTKAKDMVEETLGEALRAKVQALFEEEVVPTPLPTVRAKAKAQATPVKEEEANPKATPRKRRRTKEEATPSQEDLESILGGVKVALQKYSGITTPKGKAYPDVLFRRVRRVLEHAKENGHHNLASLARSALAHIAADPKGVAMGSWQALAARVGLPIPLGSGE